MNSEDPAKIEKPAFKPKTAPAGLYLAAAAFGSAFLHFLPKWSGVILLGIFAAIYFGLWVWAKNRLRGAADNSQ